MTYVPTVNVAVHLNATNEVAVVIEYLDHGNPNWRLVQNTYAVGAYFMQPQLYAYNPQTALRDVARLQFPGTGHYDKSVAFFGSPTWLDDLVETVVTNRDGVRVVFARTKFGGGGWKLREDWCCVYAWRKVPAPVSSG